VYGEGRAVTFTRTPNTYNIQTGSFSLDWELSDFVSDTVCLSYDYFLIKAEAGQLLRGEVSPGSTGNRGVAYVILGSPIGLYNFEGSDCGFGFWSPLFTTRSTFNWTAPQDGEYALVFMVSGFYGGPLYFRSN
jgi:hypothetical protein